MRESEVMLDSEPPTVAIVGLGLIGGSLARARLARGRRVLGLTDDDEDARLAREAGVHVLPDVASLASVRPAPEVVVLAVPLSALGTVADAVIATVDPQTVILHVAGLQQLDLSGGRGPRARVLGTHPIAGSHERGFSAARADLFDGATVWAEARADPATRCVIDELWHDTGASCVRYATAAEHDAMMSWVSHLPQLTSTVLASALAEAGIAAADGGPGLRDTTRLAGSPLALWRDLLAAAPAATDTALAGLAGTITRLRTALASRDMHAVETIWARAHAWRSAAGATAGARVAAGPPTDRESAGATRAEPIPVPPATTARPDPARSEAATMPHQVRAIRGAISVDVDEACAVRAATHELLTAIVERNGIAHEDLISAVFTVTHDLTSAFPARAAHAMGWVDVPLLCALEIPVPGALARCVRVLLHVSSDRPRSAIEHVYLRDAVALRPDLAVMRAPDAP